MIDPLVTALSGESSVTMFIGVVAGVAADGTLALDVAGGRLESVTRLRSYTDPAPGDVVHVLSSGVGATVVLGAEVARPGVPAPPAPPVPTVLAPSAAATYNRVDQTWAVGAVNQTPGVLAGAFFYPPNGLAAVFGKPPATVEMLLYVDAAAQPLGMTLISNAGPAGVLEPMSPLHTVQAPPGGAWVRLPIAWLAPLVSGLAGGIGLISNTDTALAVSDGTLRVTPM